MAVDKEIIQEGLLIDSVNAMSVTEFIDTFKEVFEHSPWVAEQAYSLKPFDDLAHLHGMMVGTVKQASRDAQLALLNAHPELTGRISVGETLARNSENEQRQAGLNECTPEQLELLKKYNQLYREKFPYPFIVAVKGMDVDAIIEMLIARVERSDEEEFNIALEQVFKIAKFRLEDLVRA